MKVFLVNADRDLLVLRDAKQQCGDLPGGRLDPGEIYQPFTRSIERELREELGTRWKYRLIDTQQPCFVFPHFIQESDSEALGLAFRAEYLSGDLTLSDEHDRMEWVSLSDYDPRGYFPAYLVDAVLEFQKSYGSGLRNGYETD
ncbi:MAG: NUDIX hydrolase [Leptospiraceae bacterium]|nr:NUDIX hydrolase [Leptospiraceae bacterium]